MTINLATCQRQRKTSKWLQNLESSWANFCDMSRPTFDVVTGWNDSGRKTVK